MNNTNTGWLFIIELYASCIPFIWGIEKRKKMYLRLLLIAFLTCMMIYAIMCTVTPDQVPKSNVLPGILIFFAVTYMAIYLCCKVSPAEAAYIFAMSYTLEHIVYCIRLLFNFNGKEYLFKAGSISYYLLFASFCFIAYRFLAKRLLENGHYRRKTWDTIVITVVVLFVVFVMSDFATMYDYETIHGMYALLICSFIFINEVNVKLQQDKQAELTAKEMLWEQAKSQYEFSKEAMESVHRTYHDLKHQLAAIKAMDASPEKEGVIGELEESATQYESMFHTGNELLDTVLTEKKLLASKSHIEMVCMADATLLTQIPVIDMYRIIGNAIDNAIEANKKITDTDARFIEVKIFKKLGLEIIQIENPSTDRTPLHSAPESSSKKEKAAHGFGLKSIKELVEKNNGFIKVQQQDYLFILRIAFPEQLNNETNAIGES